MDKSKMAKQLRWILEGRSFAKFYADDGEFGKAVTGEFTRNSPEDQANEEKVTAYLNQMIENIIKE